MNYIIIASAIIIIAVVAALSIYFIKQNNKEEEEIAYTQLIKDISDNKVEKIEMTVRKYNT